jgi:hypothetical protein
MVDIFRNKLKTNWTEEIFTVVEKRVYNVWIYFVSDLNGEKIKEGIYIRSRNATNIIIRIIEIIQIKINIIFFFSFFNSTIFKFALINKFAVFMRIV